MTDHKSQHWGFDYLLPAQAQKHITINEAIRKLDQFLHLTVVSIQRTEPPQSYPAGARYLVAENASGDWAGQDHKLAIEEDGGWQFYTPKVGWRIWDEEQKQLRVYDGTDWQTINAAGADHTHDIEDVTDLQSSLDEKAEKNDVSALDQRVSIIEGQQGQAGNGNENGLNNLPLLGVNTTADATNKLSVKSEAVLLDNNGGDAQTKINKSASTDTASLLFQSNYKGHAEIGLLGDDHFHLKISPDGNNWSEAFIIDKNTGQVNFHKVPQIGGAVLVQKNYLINGGFNIWQRGTNFTAQGYSADRWYQSLGSGGVTSRIENSLAEQDSLSGISRYAIRCRNTSSGTSRYIEQRVEDVRTLAHKTATLSFKAKGTSPNAIRRIKIKQYFGTGGSSTVTQNLPASINLTGNYQQFSVSVNIPSIANKSIRAGSYLAIAFYGADETAQAFDFIITDVKLEDGTLATPLINPPLAEELVLCQRYFEKTYAAETPPSTRTGINSKGEFTGNRGDRFAISFTNSYLTAKRGQPNITIYSPITSEKNVIYDAGSGRDKSIYTGSAGDKGFIINGSPSTTTSANSFHMWHWVADAEL